ncbi:MAG: L,D-transpeptidase family protein [Candidatus Latescibacterota bacterium]
MTRRLSHAVISGASCILAVYLAAVPLQADDRAEDIAILKRISASSIKNALAATQKIDEIAARVGISADELKQVCLALKIELPAPVEPAKPEPIPVPLKKTAEELYTDAILNYEGESPYVLLVDKNEHVLYLLKYDQGKRVIEALFPCKTGKNEGDKRERGDHRTPEGIYFFQTKLSRTDIERRVGKGNAFQYGEIAFTTDFPNRIDQLKRKNGGGIWLHGTDEPFESTPSLDTRGCVVTTNDTIKKLSRFIEIDKTPLIIVDKLIYRPEEEIEKERRSVLSMIENWRTSWSEKRLDDYIRHYSPSFSSQGLDREAWKSRKEGLARINGTLRISLQNISILKQNDGMVVRFIQDYEAENVANIGIKTLYLMQDSNGWQIVSEHFRRTN